MALLKYGPLPSKGKVAVDGGDQQIFTYKFTYSTLVIPLVVLGDVYTIYGHGRGAVLPGYTRYYCASVTADQGNDGKIWTVTATYEQMMLATSPVGSALTPMDEPWGMTFGHTPKRKVQMHAYSTWKKLLYTDYSTSTETPAHGASALNVAVVNSLGDIWDPPYEKEEKLLVISLTKNLTLSAFGSKDPLSFDDSINSANITVCGKEIPKWAGLMAVEGNRRSYIASDGTPVYYMAISYRITVDRDLWATRIVDAGIRYKKYAEPNINTIVPATATGMAHQREPKPVKLNGLGYSLDDANKGAIKKGAAALCCFFMNPEMAWSALGLPNATSVE